MQYTYSKYGSSNKRRRHLKRKMASTNGTVATVPNVAKRMDPTKVPEVTKTVADAQRENRQATVKWKAKARKLAFGVAIGLHAVALIILTVWFVQKAVLKIYEDKIDGIVVDQPPTQTKRTFKPRAAQKTVKPKAVEVNVPKNNGHVIRPDTNISLGPADFTIPINEFTSDTTIGLSTIGKNTTMMEQSRQIEIVSTVPKFELPKFENTGLNMKMDMGTSLASMELSASDDLGLTAVGIGETGQTFSEFLRLVRQRIKEEQRFPPNIRNLEEGSTTTIRFTLLRDGTIRDPKVSNSSGSRVLDNAALAAVQNAEPYPPFPDGQSGNSIRLELPIVFELVN